MTKIFAALTLILAIAALFWLITTGGLLSSFTNVGNEPQQPNTANILSFEDCVAAGYPVMESHPRRCAVPDGRVYAEEITVQPTYVNSSADLIRVDNPHAGGVTGKEFVVTGQARGNWYFEANFPIEVVDMNGNLLAGSYATAEGDWMTTAFVPFKSEMIDLPSAYIGPAWLVLKKSNASGLPENDASIWIPITVEY